MKQKNLYLKNYKNLKVLVTGTTGFKGAWLANWLNILGAKVIGVALKPEKDAILFNSFKLHKKIKQYFSDITNFNKLNDIIKKNKPDIIFHLAAQSIVSQGFKEPLKTLQTNILGSANILESCRLNKVPALVYITSDKCYLNLNQKKNFKETDILGGFDNYSSSKASAEIIFSSYFHSFYKKKNFLEVSSARAGNVMGGGDMKKNRIIPDIIKSLKYNKKLVLRKPKATRPWQHVLEPISGYLLIGDKLLNKNLKKSLLPSWNFGPNYKNCKTVRTVTELVKERWHKKNIKIKIQSTNAYHESKFLSLNIQKAKKELGWEPKLNLKETVKLTVDWYTEYFKQENIENFTQDQIQFFLDK